MQGLNQLSKEGVVGTVDLVESMHQRINTLGGLLNRGDLDKANGISGLVYRIIRKSTEISTQGIDLALQAFRPIFPELSGSKRRNQWVSILNGLFGDHLQKTNNPLALPMTFHHQGKQLSTQQVSELCDEFDGHPLLLIHGLCMNDQLWHRKDHNHGEALRSSNSIIPIYLRYNSGLAVYQNGLLLAQLMQDIAETISPEKHISVLCHSMGGLVMRSALHIAESSDQDWHQQMNKVVFLGTPHQGAVLEKTGNIIDYLISINPYSSPFAKLGHMRSRGIKNLRHGTITKDHQIIQLPKHIKSYAIAASSHDKDHKIHQKWIGDGLVSVNSALGHHKEKTKIIQIPQKQQFMFNQLGHMELLSSQRVYKRLQQIFN